ncbi:probable LRR receptor-like serine/threonine-protein kinase At3g47570 [Argentina anserina]|uniref:probable LRR receptor-like serine/threonine-protein kinase At3g47570 n=1 Tax=Argentina anserina TaxID=57926 RepID=UPI00217631C9|nr:probable LRR receptor-like serine/threonine-protein kinase At3g47570 [Potentilla anserina]
MVSSVCLAMAAQTNISIDKSALLVFKARITSDPLNIISTNWSTNTPVCTWVGVTCNKRHHRVAVLDLSYMELEGTIPPQLGNLSFLVKLRFRNNSFHGSLPQELGRLRRLKYISVVFNKLVGIIPSWFGSLSKLQSLSLSGNKFSGSIPAAIFNLSALQAIYLSYNQLSGSIPKEIGNLTMLRDLYLAQNNFIEIPKEIGTLNLLEVLNVQNNALKGAIPVDVFNMSSLAILVLPDNSLNGTLPDNICQHLPNIQVLHLTGNQLDGPLPSKFPNCKELRMLSLSDNIFSGSIPRNLGNLTQLQELYLGYNNLAGMVPPEIGDLQNLEILSLQYNIFVGLIPPTIFNMSSVTELTFTMNQLSGSLPANIGHGVPNLQYLFLTANYLTGQIPAIFMSNASKLMDIDLSNNFISGVISSTLCSFTNLEWLNLGDNNLTMDTSGPKENMFFNCLANLTNLGTLSLSYNPLDVMLPASIGNISKSLQSLLLLDCSMKGSIPSDVGNLSNLTVLDLGYNQLSGSIPASIGRLRNLQGLYLSNNKLQEHIPDEVCQLQKLTELSLGVNQFSGSIPSCLDLLAATLRKLSLRSNLLTSSVPSTLWRLTDILQLDLSSNSLVGFIPEDVGNLKAVGHIDLSKNRLSGVIPSNIGRLQDIVNLSLANNNLEGSIPVSIGSLLNLDLLDLSKNNLSGLIPKSLEALVHLTHMNLSFNKLQGEVPTGGPFENFSALSFVSNGELCGASRLHLPPCKRRTNNSLKYIVIGVLLSVLLANFLLMLILRRKRNVEPSLETPLFPQVWRKVSYLQLLRATNGFSESNLLGTGSFGSVYKGTLSDGLDVAIKVFNIQLEEAFKSFEVECQMLGNIRHRNLVKVISCCSQDDFKAVVLDYMPKGSLDKWLYSHEFTLNFFQRLNIMIDVASALEYLHHGYETHIVHCDLKPNNILLDDDMVAHVADFGIAKLIGGEDSMTRTMTLATVGYMAPEYGMEGIVTRRGDVYSFGIVLLETFTKKKPTDEMFVGGMNLKQWVAESLLADAIVEVVDANLLGTLEEQESVSMRNCFSSIMRLALACCAEVSEERINVQDALATLEKIKIKFLKDTAGGAVVNRTTV